MEIVIVYYYLGIEKQKMKSYYKNYHFILFLYNIFMAIRGFLMALAGIFKFQDVL